MKAEYVFNLNTTVQLMLKYKLEAVNSLFEWEGFISFSAQDESKTEFCFHWKKTSVHDFFFCRRQFCIY